MIRAQYFANFAADVAVTMSDISKICIFAFEVNWTSNNVNILRFHYFDFKIG